MFGQRAIGAGAQGGAFWNQHLHTHLDNYSLLNRTYEGTEVSSDREVCLQDALSRPDSQAQLLWRRLLDLLSDIVQIVVFCNHRLGTTLCYPWVRLLSVLFICKDVLVYPSSLSSPSDP